MRPGVPGGLINATLEQGAEQIRKLKRLAAERGYFKVVFTAQG